MDFFSKLKNCIEEFFLYIDHFFQEYFFCSKHAKPEDFEASIILENDFIKTTNKQEDEIDDTFEILSRSDIN
jgi:hypothetical protein